MKLTKHLLAPLVGLAALLLGTCTAQAQYINVQVNFNTVKHYETSACWESGDEEYTALIYANLDGGGWQGGSCFQINNNGSCTQGINYTPINTTTLATTLGTRLYAWEDDGGNRCSYDSGDDCKNDDSWAHTIRNLSRATWNAFNDYGTSNHKFSYSIYWNWIAPPAPAIGSASSVATTSFTANWSNSDGNYRVTSYTLYVATDSGFVNHVGGYNGLDLGTATSRSVTGLTAGQTYYFRITAANEAGTSGVSGTGSTTLPKYDQTITFTQPANKTYGDAAFALSATASSGLGVTFSLVSGPATVTGGGTVTLTGAGTVTVRASQAGNGSYNAAPNVDRSFTVNKAPILCKPADAFSVQGLPQPPFTISFQGFVNNETAAVLDTPPSAASSATAASPKGTYPITCEGGADNNYDYVRQTGTWRILERATLIRVR